MATVRLKNIRKRFGATEMIKGVDIDIEDGEFVVFVGPSGCGKSTLLRMIAGLETISGGELEIGGRVVNEIQPKERGIAMVFQSYAIFPHMTVRENIGFGLTVAKASRAEKDAAVTEAARILQMEHLLDRRPSQLSGGQRQRVAIGRAITRKPEVFLFDEPLSNLDAALRMDMRMEIGRLHKELATTMIYVTHDQVEAMTLADKIVVLRGGNIEQVGAPMDLYRDPDNRFVAGFIGSPAMNFVGGSVAEDGVLAPGLGARTLPSGAALPAPGAEVIVGVRPQHLTLAPGDSHLVDLVERLGGVSYAYLVAGTGDRLVVELSEDDPAPRSGERVGLEIAAERVMLFDAASERRLR
jgi:lactose/L-arabinose transport system ATP-binding protein